MKRRIQELCGFDKLSREERLIRANEILNSTELKQSICHKILGTTFKDIDRAMDGIIKERRLTPEQEDELELMEIVPEKFEPKFDPELEFKINKKAADKVKVQHYSTYTREEVVELLAAQEILETKSLPQKSIDYPTYSYDEVQRLVQEHFSHVERSIEDKWDSVKMTESAQKTGSTTKRTRSSNT